MSQQVPFVVDKPFHLSLSDLPAIGPRHVAYNITDNLFFNSALHQAALIPFSSDLIRSDHMSSSLILILNKVPCPAQGCTLPRLKLITHHTTNHLAWYVLDRGPCGR